MENLMYALKQIVYYVPREYGLEWVEVVGMGCLALASLLSAVKVWRRYRAKIAAWKLEDALRDPETKNEIKVQMDLAE